MKFLRAPRKTSFLKMRVMKTQGVPALIFVKSGVFQGTLELVWFRSRHGILSGAETGL